MKKRFYPQSEDQQQQQQLQNQQQQQPLGQPNAFQPLQPSNSGGMYNPNQYQPQTVNTQQQNQPFNPTQPIQNTTYGNQPSTPPPNHQPNQLSTPPITQPMTQSQLGESKKRVYIDPEGLSSYEEQQPQQQDPNQLANQMNNMSLGGNQNQQYNQQYQQQYQPQFQQQQQQYQQPQGFQPIQSSGSQNAYQPTNQPSQVQGSDAPISTAAKYQCPPTYMRMTMNVVPNTTTLLNKCNIPFGCVIHPMAKPTSKEDRIPVINFGASGILRCRRCRAYINPFVTFIEGGRRWRCNLCSLPNDVPGEYFSPVDSMGRRQDMDERPELSKGCVEFIAPSEYMVRPPQPPAYLFVIDVSYNAISSGSFNTTIETIKRTLNDFPGYPRTRIGFITYDSSVHFYNLKSTLTTPQMLVVPDIDDIFLPLPEDMLVNLQESKTVVETLLNNLPKMFASSQNGEAVTGVALKAAFEVIKNIGGKIMLFSSTLPNNGVGKLKNREDLKLLGTDRESSLLLPEENYYKNFALDCSRQQISVDCFLFSPVYTDVATLGCLPQFTGGQLYYYPNFKLASDGERFYRDLIRDITRETGFEAVFRVRTSKGLKAQAHFGNFFIRSTDLLALPNVDADKAFAVQLSLSENITSSYSSFQSALLYTTSNGERRIRVFTQCLVVTSSLVDIFKSLDCEAVATLTTKMAIEKALQTRLSDAREALVNKCIEILTVYRTDLAPQSNSGSLMLPETLKTFPLYILSLVKNVLFRSGTEVRPDERSYALMHARTLPISLTIPFLYGRMFQINNLPPIESGLEDIALPTPLNLSSEKLDRAGMFLVEDGQQMWVWIGKIVPTEVLNQIFGIPSLDGIDTSLLTLPLLENDLSKSVNSLVNQLREQRPTYLPLYFVREGDAREVKFFSFLIEDRSKNVHSYYDFLVNLHQRIQAKVTKN